MRRALAGRVRLPLTHRALQKALGLRATLRAGARLDLRKCCHDVKSPFLDLTLLCPATEACLQLRPRLKELRLTAGCPEAAALPGMGLPWLDWAAPPARRLVLTDFAALDLSCLPAGGRGSTIVVRSFDPGWQAAIGLPAARPGPGPHHLSVLDYSSREGSRARVALAPCLPTLGHLEVRGERQLCLEVPHPTLRHWGEELAALQPPDERSLLVHALCEEGPVFRFASGQCMASHVSGPGPGAGPAVH